MTETEIIILETSDVHGNLYPIQYATNQYDDVGLAKIATLVKNERSQNSNTFLIDNGDLIQGTPFMYHYFQTDMGVINPMILAANEIGYEAAVFGNHEFNYGLEALNKAVSESNFPWISATILDEATNEPYFGTPYKIFTTKESIKIAVLGLTTPYIPHWEQPDNIKGLKFLDAVEAAKQWVPYLREEQGADIVIVSYHGGFERDLKSGEPTENLTGENQGYELCTEVEGIDVLLTGHQHRKIEDTEINGVLIVQPGNNGIALGKVSLKVEETTEGWKITNKKSQLISVNEVGADEDILKIGEPYETATQKWLDQPIGNIKGDMLITNPFESRTKANALIEFINKVQMDATGVDIANTAIFNDLAPGFPERVTMRDVMANYIYPNTLKVLELSGHDIKAALEKTAEYFSLDNQGDIQVSDAYTDPKPQHYNYDMWTGIEYVLNISKSLGNRVTKLNYQSNPMNLDEKYHVVMNNYRAGGGGDYTMFQDKPVIKDVQIDVSELLANYFKKHPVIKATYEPTWFVTKD